MHIFNCQRLSRVHGIRQSRDSTLSKPSTLMPYQAPSGRSVAAAGFKASSPAEDTFLIFQLAHPGTLESCRFTSDLLGHWYWVFEATKTFSFVSYLLRRSQQNKSTRLGHCWLSAGVAPTEDATRATRHSLHATSNQRHAPFCTNTAYFNTQIVYLGVGDRIARRCVIWTRKTTSVATSKHERASR